MKLCILYNNKVHNIADMCTVKPCYKMNFRKHTKFVVIITRSSYQDIVIHVQSYSKPNRA